MRLPSVLSGICSVLVIYFFIGRVRGRLEGLVAALLLATSAYNVYYSQEVRMYGPEMFFSLLVLWFLHRAVNEAGWLNWVLYASAIFWAMPLQLFLIPFVGAVSLAAFSWLCFTKSLPSRKARRVRLVAVVLCGLLGSTGLAYWLAASGYDPMAFFGGTSVDPTTSLIVERKGELYQTTPSDYLSAFSEYFHYDSRIAGLTVVFFGLVGFLSLLHTQRALALMLAFPAVLVPLPLFFLETRYMYQAKQTCYMVPIGIICISAGMVVTARTLARVLFEEVPGWWLGLGKTGLSEKPIWRTNVGTGAFLALLLLGLFPSTHRSLLRQYTHRTSMTNWKQTVEFMRRTLRPNDVMYYAGEGRLAEAVHFDTRMALDWGLPEGEVLMCSLRPREIVRALTYERARNTLFLHPDSAIWFLLHPERSAENASILKSLGASEAFPNARYPKLWFLGEPTVNLVGSGGFESGEFDCSGEPCMELVGPQEAYEGSYCVRLSARPDAPRGLSLPITPSEYRIRNPGFEIWANGVPLGWMISQETPQYIHAESPGFSGRHALAIECSQRAVALRQQIGQNFPTCPGEEAKLQVEAMAKAEGGDLLTLELMCNVPGSTVRARAAHPGGAKWHRLSLTAEIPRDADTRSLALEIRRSPGSGQTVLMDDVEVRVLPKAAKPTPNRHKAFRLSLMLKYEHVMDPGYVGLLYHSPSKGKLMTHTFHTFAGTRDWHYLSFPFVPETHLAPDATDWYAQVVLKPDPETKARALIDNVQVEMKDYATPFVEGSRLPHDEALVLAGS